MTVSWKTAPPMPELFSASAAALLPVSPKPQAESTPRGRHHIRVCRGIACHVKGSAAVLETLQRSLGILPGEVTPDGNFSLEVVSCLNACGMSPVIAVNDQLYPGVTPQRVECLIEDLDWFE